MQRSTTTLTDRLGALRWRRPQVLRARRALLMAGGVFCVASNALGVSIGIVPPSTQVIEADAVALVGVVSAGPETVQVKVTQALKGNIVTGQSDSVTFPKPPFFFDRERFLKSLVGREVLVLGAINASGGGLTLGQYQFSVWPNGLPYSSLALSSAEEDARFARKVLQLESLGTDPGALVGALLDAEQEPQLYAAVDFAEHHLLRHLRGSDSAVVRSLLLSLMLLDRSRTADEYIIARTVSLAPVLAQSLALPRLATIAAGNGPSKDTAASHLRAQLRARGLAVQPGATDAALAGHVEALRAEDVRRYLSLLAASRPELVLATERLLGWILSVTEAEAAAAHALKDADQRMRHWEQLLARRPRP